MILEPLPVNLDGGAEGGIAFLARCCTQGDALIVDERTVYGLATGHEGQDVTHVDNLLVVQGLAVDEVTRGRVLGLALCGDDDLLKLQIGRQHEQVQCVVRMIEVNLSLGRLIANTGDPQCRFAATMDAQGKCALPVGHAPLVTSLASSVYTVMASNSVWVLYSLAAFSLSNVMLVELPFHT